MKNKLFKQSKPDVTISEKGIKTPTFSIPSVDGRKVSKKISILFLATVAITGLMIGILMGINAFFNSYYFEFRTPVIFQQPILLRERDQALVSPIPEPLQLEVQAYVEPTPTPEPQVVLSKKAEGCLENYPEVADKLVEAFPNEPATIIELVCRESSLNAEAVNPSSGACGLFQAYPCNKMKCELGDADCQIEWGKNYIENRYETVEAALLFHDANNWY